IAQVLYKYSASIYLSTKDNSIAFTSQHLRMYIYPNEVTLAKDDIYDDSIDIQPTLSSGLITSKINKVDHSIIDMPNHRIGLGSKEKLSKVQIDEIFAEQCKRSAKDMYLFNSLEEIVPQMSILTRDLLGARSFRAYPVNADTHYI